MSSTTAVHTSLYRQGLTVRPNMGSDIAYDKTGDKTPRENKD